jgi:hypothetical protein
VKLERLSGKMDAEFVDYQPSTGTWTFKVSHFSKYSYVEEDDDDPPSPKELQVSQVQRQTVSLVQRARPALVEKFGDNAILELGFNGMWTNEPKREFIEDEDMDEFSMKMFAAADIPATKKIRFDDLLDQSKLLLHTVPSTLIKPDVKPIISEEREVVDTFRGISIKEPSVFSLAPRPRHMEALFRRGCYLHFRKDWTLLSDANAYSASLAFSKVTIVPRLEEFFHNYLASKGRFEELAKYHRLAVLQQSPPSLLLRLIDSFVLDIVKTTPQDEVEEIITRLCDALFVPFSVRQGIQQKQGMLKWLRFYLKRQSAHNKTPTLKGKAHFQKIYTSLVNGQIAEAARSAVAARRYNLSLRIIANDTEPLSATARTPLLQKNVYTDAYEKAILLCLSGDVMKEDVNVVGEGVMGLHWLQALAVIAGLWARRTTPLEQCVDRLDELIRHGYIKI